MSFGRRLGVQWRHIGQEHSSILFQGPHSGKLTKHRVEHNSLGLILLNHFLVLTLMLPGWDGVVDSIEKMSHSLGSTLSCHYRQ